MNIIELLDKSESLEYHLARLLILLGVFGGRNQSAVNGITKLVKLDFLLRYPTYLERALRTTENEPSDIQIKSYERDSVESKMIRYKYGPWDPKFRLYLSILLSKNLINVELRKNTIYIGINEDGHAIYKQLIDIKEFSDFNNRSIILKNNFNIGGTKLKDFIYETFPEIKNLKLGDEII